MLVKIVRVEVDVDAAHPLDGLGPNSRDAVLVLQDAFDDEERLFDDDHAVASKKVGPHDDVGDAGLVLECEKDEALGGPRPLTANDEPGGSDLDAIFEGADIVDNSGPNGGLLVTRVDPNSPAADRGLQPGDIITKVNTVRIRTLAEAVPIMENARAILLEVQRGDRSSIILMR